MDIQNFDLYGNKITLIGFVLLIVFIIFIILQDPLDKEECELNDAVKGQSFNGKVMHVLEKSIRVKVSSGETITFSFQGERTDAIKSISEGDSIWKNKTELTILLFRNGVVQKLEMDFGCRH